MRALSWAWSLAVAGALVAALPWAVAHGGGDWRVFVSAGTLAGTAALLHPPQDWQAFFYLPGAAWPLVAAARVPPAISFMLNAAAMLGCAMAAAVLASRTYGLATRTAIALYALFPPVVYAAAIIGQNAPFGLLLAQAAVAGLAARSVALTALPIGMLLYKPTYALPLVALLVVRGLRRELSVVAACAALWYLASVAAAGGDWSWPAAWLRVLTRFAAGDLAVNGAFAVGIPAVLLRNGVAPSAVLALCILVAAASAGALRIAKPAEAASAASLVGLALSPHAWAYDAALALPMIAFTAARLGDPARTRFLFALALVTPLFLLAPQIGFDPLAPAAAAGTIGWLAVRARQMLGRAPETPHDLHRERLERPVERHPERLERGRTNVAFVDVPHRDEPAIRGGEALRPPPHPRLVPRGPERRQNGVVARRGGDDRGERIGRETESHEQRAVDRRVPEQI